MSRYKAVADIGTNSFHMIIAAVNEGKIKTVHRKRVVMRLGTDDNGILKHISKNEIEKSVRVLQAFSKVAKSYNAPLHAVATSAVRESDNANEFIEAVRKNCGIQIDVINGVMEAVYIQRGMMNALLINDKKLLCVDIGGGSTEVIIGTLHSRDLVRSFRLGAVRLTKIFFPDLTVTPRTVHNCSEHILITLRESGISEYKADFDIAAGASGTIMAAAVMIAVQKHGSIPPNMNGFSFDSEELNHLVELILESPTPKDRLSIPGMEKGREDIIPAGILILKHLFDALSIKEMRISGYALREGYLLNVWDEESV